MYDSYHMYVILIIYTMSPQNHEKQMFWPSKNQVIYHQKPL